MIADIEQLRQSEIFDTLSPEELSLLSPLCTSFSAVQDATIFLEEHAARSLYIVSSGQVSLQKKLRVPHASRPRRTTVAVCRPGNIFGWSALVEPYKYTLSAVAWESSRLIRIDAQMLRWALDLHPDIGYKVMRSLSTVFSHRLRQTTDALIKEQETAYNGDPLLAKILSAG